MQERQYTGRITRRKDSGADASPTVRRLLPPDRQRQTQSYKDRPNHTKTDPIIPDRVFGHVNQQSHSSLTGEGKDGGIDALRDHLRLPLPDARLLSIDRRGGGRGKRGTVVSPSQVNCLQVAVTSGGYEWRFTTAKYRREQGCVLGERKVYVTHADAHNTQQKGQR